MLYGGICMRACISSLRYFIDDMVHICIWLMVYIWYMLHMVDALVHDSLLFIDVSLVHD
jgi:hypothetical protein